MTRQLALFDGAARGQRGMAVAETAEAIHGDWVKRADLAIRLFASGGQPFTAEDVRRHVGDPVHPNAMGARLNAAARKGIIECTGITTATRADRHASVLRVWVGK